jgi:crotonobetainyl-CoA:carnitine CoA-transferase CaiB-like acyl-CoA transferase
MCGPVYSVDQTFADPHVKGRGMRVDLDRDGVDTVSLVANPIRFGGAPVDDYRAPPFLGRDTDEVLFAELGLSKADISKLRQEGVV